MPEKILLQVSKGTAQEISLFGLRRRPCFLIRSLCVCASRCLIKFYSELPPRKPETGGPIEWSCPGCRNLCSCAACRRGREKNYSKKESNHSPLFPGGKPLDP